MAMLELRRSVGSSTDTAASSEELPPVFSIIAVVLAAQALAAHLPQER